MVSKIYTRYLLPKGHYKFIGGDFDINFPQKRCLFQVQAAADLFTKLLNPKLWPLMCAIKCSNDLPIALWPFRYQVWRWHFQLCKTKLDLNQISGHPLELPALIFILAIMEIRVGVDQMKARSHGGEAAISKPIWRRGYHNCISMYWLTLNQKHNYHHCHGRGYVNLGSKLGLLEYLVN